MNKPYILSPAGSFEALNAAVNAGADEVYFGYGEFNARQNAKNFTSEELERAVKLCRILNVKTNITVNTLLTDREMTRALNLVYEAASLGADAFIVQDIGLATEIKRQMPSVCIHASTQCACHNAEGARRLSEMGFSRIVLAREMPMEEIKKVTKLGIETEIFIHGALCVCHSGMCLMSSVIGGRSGNRGFCAQPCRLAYSLDGGKNVSYPLSLKDSCLGTRTEDILSLGVTSLKIEGRMKSPEYVYGTTKIWREIIDGGKNASAEQIKALENVFSRNGFTDKYFTGEYMRDNKSMYGVRSDKDKENTRKAEKNINTENAVETRKRNIKLECKLFVGERAEIKAYAGDTGVEYISDFVIQKAIARKLDREEAEASISKLGNTLFKSEKTTVFTDGETFLTKAQLNLLRREVICRLEEKLLCTSPVVRKTSEEKTFVISKNENRKPTASFFSCETAKIALCHAGEKYVSIPLEEFIGEAGETEHIVRKLIESGTSVGVRLPRVIFDDECENAGRLIKKAAESGVTFAEISNIGHIDACKREKLLLFAAPGMNVFNSYTIFQMEKLGFSKVCASPELNEAQIRDLYRPKDCEVYAFVKGRLPLMVLESCIFKAAGKCKNGDGASCGVLTDRIGKKFAVYGEKRLCSEKNYKPCRNIIVNSVESDILKSKEKIEKMNVGLGLIYVWECQN